MRDPRTCPKCGGTNGYTRREYVSGYEERSGGWGDDPSSEEFANNDKVRYRRQQTVICVDCEARIRVSTSPSGTSGKR